MPEISGSKIGHFCWFELATTDQAVAKKFYGGLFGWPADVPPHWMIYASVTNCDEAAKKVAELGGRVCVPPTDIPEVGRFAVINDP